jgi:uridine kinase
MSSLDSAAAPPQAATGDLIRLATPRQTVHARLSDGRIYEAAPGTAIGRILDVAASGAQTLLPPLAAIVGGRLRELHVPLLSDADITPITLADADGARIYRRSLAFVLITAASELFPEADVNVEHSAPVVGAYFCAVRGRPALSREDIVRLEERMRELVERDEPIAKGSIPVMDAIQLFRDRGEIDKARLLAHRPKDAVVVVYTLRGRRDCFQGYMVPSTGRLHKFTLEWLPRGFLLRFPHQASPQELLPSEPYPRLFEVFDEAAQWLDKLGIRHTGALNDAIEQGRLGQVALVAEALHEARIARIAADIVAAGSRLRVVLIAGPSSAGKTTFARRLAVQLLANGRRPFPVSLDDYFLDHARTPRDERGELDFESLHALDVALFNANLLQLMAGDATALPRYSFVHGRREEGPTVTLDGDHVVLVEGIHGLNPALVPALPPEAVYRVYVSPLTQLNLDRHNRVATSDCRLVRRVVRDAATRGYTAADTIRRWPSVQRGEKLHIFPYQEHSDAIFNSSLVYELSVLRQAAEPLLLQVRPDTLEYLEANRLLSFLQWFRPSSADVVPENSILREFVGRSVLEHFRHWR